MKHEVWRRRCAIALTVCATAPLAISPAIGDKHRLGANLLYQGLAAADAAIAGSTVQRALESSLSHQTQHWHSHGSSAAGSVTPLRTYRTKAGFFCREFREELFFDSAPRSQSRTACRDTDGIWKSVDPDA